jgi:HEAT repeat protein/cyclophilin family peptidyl-prolyl cis-trans isomerase
VRASVAFAYGQLKDASSVSWLDSLLTQNASVFVAKEAAQALGKIRTDEARASLTRYLNTVKSTNFVDVAIAEALLSMGRFPAGGDLAPIIKWMDSRNENVRWCVAWALYRAGDPAAVPHLLKMSSDSSSEVRYWAMRGLAPAAVDKSSVDRRTATARLLAGTKDRDRRVRTEALRALLPYADDTAFGALVEALGSNDTWISTSAAEFAGRFSARADELRPKLIAAAAPTKPLWLRQVSLTPLVTMAPETAIEVATTLARSDVAVARSSAVTALGRLGAPGSARLEELRADPTLKDRLPTGGRGAFPPGPTPPPKSQTDYRSLVEKWIVPDYQGKQRPRAIWDTPRGRIELELYPGDAPLCVEYFVHAVTSGDIVGTEFGRVVPNFVAQQQSIRNAPTLRDEINRRGLIAANLAIATAGLDTGRPGYTLGNTPQPHNEGNYTSVGRIVSDIKVVEALEWGDKILAARMK